MAIYENLPGGYTGYGLFQIRDWDWCDRGRNLCHMSCSGRCPPTDTLGHWGLQHRAQRPAFQGGEFIGLEQGGRGPGRLSAAQQSTQRGESGGGQGQSHGFPHPDGQKRHQDVERWWGGAADIRAHLSLKG